MDEELKELLGLEDVEEDDSQAGAVDQQDENATDEGANDDGDEELLPEDQLADGTANHQQTHEDNHKYAEARKIAEAETNAEREKNRKLTKDLETMKEALKGYGYEGTPQEIADKIISKQSGKSIDEIVKEREENEARIKAAAEKAPEVIQAKKLIEANAQQMAMQHLANITRVNPDIASYNDLFEKTPKEDMDAIMTLTKNGWHIDKAYFKICGNAGQAKEKKPDTKSHMKQVNGSGNDSTDVFFGDDEFETAASLMPGLTREEYRNYCKESGRK